MSSNSTKDSHRSGSPGAATTSSSAAAAAATVSSDEDDDSDGDDEEAATKELAAWRSAVTGATSAAQLSLYLSQLNRSIAWEKSIMKVVCDFLIVLRFILVIN